MTTRGWIGVFIWALSLGALLAAGEPRTAVYVFLWAIVGWFVGWECGRRRCRDAVILQMHIDRDYYLEELAIAQREMRERAAQVADQGMIAFENGVQLDSATVAARAIRALSLRQGVSK